MAKTVRDYFEQFAVGSSVAIGDSGYEIQEHDGGLTVLSPRTSAEELGWRDDSELSLLEACPQIDPPPRKLFGAPDRCPWCDAGVDYDQEGPNWDGRQWWQELWCDYGHHWREMYELDHVTVLHNDDEVLSFSEED